MCAMYVHVSHTGHEASRLKRWYALASLARKEATRNMRVRHRAVPRPARRSKPQATAWPMGTAVPPTAKPCTTGAWAICTPGCVY